MKIGLNWLTRYLDIDRPIKEIEEALTLIGFEVESVERTGLEPLPEVVVGEVRASEKHPNADRLSVCRVVTGQGGEERTIVCGASNYAVGDRVLVALPGAVLPGGFKIGKSRLRGVESAGMMCSARELELGDEHEGILILEGSPSLGTPVNEVFPDSDTIFDIEVTPNRPDCLSYVGIARELGAYFGLPFTYPEVAIREQAAGSGANDGLIEQVRVDTVENCPHYRAYSIRGVSVGPSPEWLRRLLVSAGLRPINNVVDATNFVLLELGQPLHAFDAARLRGKSLIIRQARDRESITTLDGKTRDLDADMVVIADTERAVAIGGVMGANNAEVDSGTADVVLEAAYFRPANIRRTSRRLGLSSDAAYRYERGVDPKGTEFAALRAVGLILETAGGTVSGPPLVEGNSPTFEREIEITPEYVSERLGFDVASDAVRDVFERLQFDVAIREEADGQERWQVGIPSYRLDLERRVDLVEEFLRIYGTDKIPLTPVRVNGIHSVDDPISTFKNRAADHLVGQRFNQCVNYTMRSADETGRWYSQSAVNVLAVANPLASDQSLLRTSLIPGLLDNLATNHNRGNFPERFFEVGGVFRELRGRLWELVSVAFLIVKEPRAQSWLERAPPDFFTASAIVGDLLRLSGAPDIGLLDPIVGDDVLQDGHAAGAGSFASGCEAQVGLLSLAILKEWSNEGAVYAGEVSFLPETLNARIPRPDYCPFSLFPPARRDLALVVDEAEYAGTVCTVVEAAAKKAAGESFDVESVEVFDVYRGPGVPEDKKSIAIAIVFRSPDRTLNEEELNTAFQQVQERVVDGTGYVIRS